MSSAHASPFRSPDHEKKHRVGDGDGGGRNQRQQRLRELRILHRPGVVVELCEPRNQSVEQDPHDGDWDGHAEEEEEVGERLQHQFWQVPAAALLILLRG